jgi:hypothetical protein
MLVELLPWALFLGLVAGLLSLALGALERDTSAANRPKART